MVKIVFEVIVFRQVVQIGILELEDVSLLRTSNRDHCQKLNGH